MSKFFQLAIFLFILTITLLFMHFQKEYHTTGITNLFPRQPWLTVLLVPLDSRPPCTQFVEELAQIAGIKLLMPEPEILDEYNNPANKEALRKWLQETSPQANAGIISVDMLIHGSLVASRLSLGTIKDSEDVIALLTKIHKENPRLKLYAFTIIPRLLIADSQENAAFQKSMLQYSVLKDQVSTFGNPQDTKKLAALEEQIPVKIINHYRSIYEQNTKLNVALMNMVETNMLSGLIIGQDDGQPFGIPNMNKQRMQHLLEQKPALANKVFITRGTDEVALTLLGHIGLTFSQYQPRIFVAYSTLEAPQITMPFMPNTVAKTVQEKISIAGALQVDRPEEADYILYVHVGTKKAKASLVATAQEVETLLDEGYKVALVDLTENFQVSESLLPLLIKRNGNVSRLIAYAGWNTTSNSIGTAVTQASLFMRSLASCQGNRTELLPLYQENLEFLTARFLDDLFFQKEINPTINKELRSLHIDPYQLRSHYYQTNDKIQKLMYSKARWLLREALYNHTIPIETNAGRQEIMITNLDIKTHLPWQRTFEIQLQPTVFLRVVTE